MDGANGSSSSPAPFLLKTYEMVDDHLTNGVVSWSRTGHSFVVWNPPEFASDLLPKYFKHNNFSSFIRQLNTYGFRKVDPEQWEFANEEFIRGQRHLLNNIRRRKPIHSHSGNVNAVTDSEREEYEKEIEKLKQERVSLETEVESYRQKNRGYEDELRSLGQTLQGIDQRQRQLVDSLTRLLQSPGYGSGLMDQSESPSKKRRLLALRYLRDEEAKLMKEDPSHSSPLPVLDLKQVEKLDSSLTFWETFLRGIDQIPPENEPSSPMESDINAPPCTPPQECCTESLAYVTSSIRIDPEARPNKPSGVDMNISPDARSAEGSGAIQAVAANDVFWQQFLTEAPASSMVQAEQREAYERTTNPSRFADEHKPWWTVDGLATQHTGHLSQAERI